VPTFNLALSRLLTDWCSQDLIEVLPAAVYVCNAAAVVVAYNRRAVELWGREPTLGDSDEKYCGAHRLYHLDGTPLPHRETPMELVLRTGEPARDRQVIIERPDGSRITALVNIAPLFAEAGKLAGAVNCFQDLTAQEEAARERIRLEEELLQAQKIDVLGHLTAGVAHDFNNLLAAVFGNLEMLKKRALDTGSQRLLHNATHAVENGERLIQQLLAFVRKEELSPKAVDLNQLLGGMLQLLQTSIGGTIRVEMRKQPGLWPVLVDPNQFELVLLNLAINARDAMPEGGTLTIEARNSNFGASDRPRDLSAGDCAVLSIRDTGTGMSEAVRLRAFDPFFTTKGSRQRVRPGAQHGAPCGQAIRRHRADRQPARRRHDDRSLFATSRDGGSVQGFARQRSR
jgi:signal transduction histidine kinase